MTYGARIEGIKSDVRSALRQDLSREQYDEFRAWELDPNMIEDLDDSPWADFNERVAERVEELRRDS